MKVYQVKLVLGKDTQYNKDGKLKNQVISPKLDEFELANMLDDRNWVKIGACEIECISCIDYTPKTKTSKAVIVKNESRRKEVSDLILSTNKAAIKPKTAKDILKEQSEMMAKMAAKIEELKENKQPEKTEGREVLEAKANELNISFRANIGDEKLLAKIVAVEPEFKL